MDSCENSDMQDLIRTVSVVVDAVGTSEFPVVLAETVREIVSHDSTLMLGAERGGAPVLLHDGLGAGERDAFRGAYLDGAYLLAPGYRAGQDTGIVGVHTISEVFPGEIVSSDYFQAYWGETGMIDELFIFIRLDGERVIWLAMGRYGSVRPFSKDDVQRLAVLEPVLGAAARRHWNARPFHAEQSVRSIPDHERCRLALENFGRRELSPREFDVCQLLLRGHSSKSAARELDISPETERIHRRRIFSKLEVSSQVELLALFVRALSMDNAPA